jgi:excinuclease ABC subunit A
MQDTLKVVGAREHNLKNIDVEIPRERLVVITGLSGSGKSSLAFDTIYAEGQRRYVESLSSYARQFLGVMEKPDVDEIKGLSPAISIDQKSAAGGPRSTVGTVTEIYDYLRVFYARAGIPHCPVCGREVTRQSTSQIRDKVSGMKAGTKIVILSPKIEGQKGEHKHIAAEAKKAGFVRLRVDGTIVALDEFPELDKNKKHTIEIVVDRMVIPGPKDPTHEEEKTRLAESIEVGLKWGNGKVVVNDADSGEDHIYSELFACPVDGTSIPEIAPRSFSFNSPYGACPVCTGLGTRLVVDPDLVIPNKRLTLGEGAIRPWGKTYLSWYNSILTAVCEKERIPMDVPVSELKLEQLKTILYGTGDELYYVKGYPTTFEGVVPNLERRYKETDSDYIKREIESYMTTKLCPSCLGKRLKPEFLAVTIDDHSIADVAVMTVDKVQEFFKLAKLSPTQTLIAERLIKEINERCQFLIDVGLDYLTLDRSAPTLSGGEAQRIRLATQVGSKLMGVLYILDEPTIGLHPRDDDRLISILKDLRDIGNTVIVVEHDEQMIRAADWVIDVGPGAGEHGGRIIAQGTPDQVIRNGDSVTGQYLSGKKGIEIPIRRRQGNGAILSVLGASENNLKNINVEIPLATFTVVTGVSGSGKSTLVNDILGKALSNYFYRANEAAGKHKEIKGLQYLDKVIVIDQSPIGRTPRSNPATYTGAFTPIRDLFAATEDARSRGYKPGRFSFNVRGGRCEVCRGEGHIKVEMHFLPDVYIVCEECKGKRYNREALEINYKGKTIADVLDMTVEVAHEFFKNIPAIAGKLSVLEEVGLGYIRLGQPATTLSGGEAQRVKLATELAKRETGKTLYILDEPTTGLHFEDIKRLLSVLQELTDRGNTVLVIEHNLHVIKCADWVIDLGPDGGDNGGEVVATGTPEEIAAYKKSYTGQFLKEMLKHAKKETTRQTLETIQTPASALK